MVDKLLAISIVEEYRSSGKLIGQKNVAFKNIMESIANEYSNKEDHFLFGYSSDLITMNSLAIRTVQPIPNLLILNSTTLKYYLLSDNIDEIGDTYQAIRANIEKFLDKIIHEPDTLIVSCCFFLPFNSLLFHYNTKMMNHTIINCLTTFDVANIMYELFNTDQ